MLPELNEAAASGDEKWCSSCCSSGGRANGKLCSAESESGDHEEKEQILSSKATLLVAAEAPQSPDLSPLSKPAQDFSLGWDMEAFLRQQVSWESRCVELSRKLCFYSPAYEKRTFYEGEWKRKIFYRGPSYCFAQNVNTIQKEIRRACEQLRQKVRGRKSDRFDTKREDRGGTKWRDYLETAAKKMVVRHARESKGQELINEEETLPMTTAENQEPQFDGAEGCWLLTLMELQCDQLLLYACSLESERNNKVLEMDGSPSFFPFSTHRSDTARAFSFTDKVCGKLFDILLACHRTAVSLLQHLHPLLSPLSTCPSSYPPSAASHVFPSVPAPPMLRVLLLSLRLRALRHVYLTTPCMWIDERRVVSLSDLPAGPPATIQANSDTALTSCIAPTAPHPYPAPMGTNAGIRPHSGHLSPLHPSPSTPVLPASFSTLDQKKYDNEEQFLTSQKQRLSALVESLPFSSSSEDGPQSMHEGEKHKVGLVERKEYPFACMQPILPSTDALKQEVDTEKRSGFSQKPDVPFSDANERVEMKKNRARKGMESVLFLMRTLTLPDGGGGEGEVPESQNSERNQTPMRPPSPTNPIANEDGLYCSEVMTTVMNAIQLTMLELLHALHLMHWEAHIQVGGHPEGDEPNHGSGKNEKENAVFSAKQVEPQSKERWTAAVEKEGEEPMARAASTIPIFLSKWWNPTLYSILLSVCELTQWRVLSLQEVPLLSANALMNRDGHEEIEGGKKRDPARRRATDTIPPSLHSDTDGVPHLLGRKEGNSGRENPEMERKKVSTLRGAEMPSSISRIPFSFIRTVLHLIALCLRQPCCSCTRWKGDTASPTAPSQEILSEDTLQDSLPPPPPPPPSSLSYAFPERLFPLAIQDVLQTIDNTHITGAQQKESVLVKRMVAALKKSCVHTPTGLVRFTTASMGTASQERYSPEGPLPPHDNADHYRGGNIGGAPSFSPHRMDLCHSDGFHLPPVSFPPSSATTGESAVGGAPTPLVKTSFQLSSSSALSSVEPQSEKMPILKLAHDSETKVMSHLVKEFKQSSPFYPPAGLSCDTFLLLPHIVSRPGFIFSGIFCDELLDWNYSKGMHIFTQLGHFRSAIQLEEQPKH